MEKLLSTIKISVNKQIYLKDPESTELGKRILSQSLEMITEMGLEQFTFRKLAEQLGTAESSIYRYFENKHKLLIYFISWYWSWIEYQIVFSTTNLAQPELKLSTALDILCQQRNLESAPVNFSLKHLHNLLISESSKAYLTKEVDGENKSGFFMAFKNVVRRLEEIIHEINPECLFAKTLSSTVIEGILHQHFFAQHLPSLTDCHDDHIADKLAKNYYTIIFNSIKA